MTVRTMLLVWFVCYVHFVLLQFELSLLKFELACLLYVAIACDNRICAVAGLSRGWGREVSYRGPCDIWGAPLSLRNTKIHQNAPF